MEETHKSSSGGRPSKAKSSLVVENASTIEPKVLPANVEEKKVHFQEEVKEDTEPTKIWTADELREELKSKGIEFIPLKPYCQPTYPLPQIPQWAKIAIVSLGGFIVARWLFSGSGKQVVSAITPDQQKLLETIADGIQRLNVA